MYGSLYLNRFGVDTYTHDKEIQQRDEKIYALKQEKIALTTRIQKVSKRVFTMYNFVVSISKHLQIDIPALLHQFEKSGIQNEILNNNHNINLTGATSAASLLFLSVEQRAIKMLEAIELHQKQEVKYSQFD